MYREAKPEDLRRLLGGANGQKILEPAASTICRRSVLAFLFSLRSNKAGILGGKYHVEQVCG